MTAYRKETVQEYLSRGGLITKCPARVAEDHIEVDQLLGCGYDLRPSARHNTSSTERRRGFHYGFAVSRRYW